MIEMDKFNEVAGLLLYYDKKIKRKGYFNISYERHLSFRTNVMSVRSHHALTKYLTNGANCAPLFLALSGIGIGDSIVPTSYFQFLNLIACVLHFYICFCRFAT